ncbi:MAG: SusC/RagA family TonB-linked outer membrane protein [Mangrovibacterium sp.]
MRGGKQTINAILDEETIGIDEVVAVGYGTMKKINLTGAVANVNVEKEMISRPLTNLSTVLSGMTAGLQVMQSSGQPNSDGASLLIRGAGTLNTSSPLVLVDGMEQGFGNVNPNDVASITVLKDAASCAIYGNRGANGVILITTKKGTKGKINVNYTGIFSFNQPSNLIKTVNNYADYMELINESAFNVGQNAAFSQETIDRFRAAEKNPNGIAESGVPNYVAYPNTDWYKEVFRNRMMHEQTVSVLGATDRVNFNFSGSFLDNPGLISGTDMKKYYLRSNIIANVTDWLQIGNRTYGFQSNVGLTNLSDYLTSIGGTRNVPGIYPYYDGKYGGVEANEENPEAINPLWRINELKGSNNYAQVNTSLFADVIPFKDFVYHINFDYTRYWNQSKYYQTSDGQYSFRNSSYVRQPKLASELSSYFALTGYYRWRLEQTLTYNKIFDSVHEVGALAGYEEMYYFSDNIGAQKKGLVDESITNLSTATQMMSITGTDTDYASRSFFGRMTYAYDSRYLFEADLRYDGSSRFSPDRRWGLFPSFSAGWRISQERFMAGSPFNNLKLRASWGKLGNNSIGNYDWQATYSTSNYSFASTKISGLAVTALANTHLEWEATSITNLGLEASILNSRLTAEIDVYDKLTDGILYRPNLYLTMGNKTAALENIAEVSNRGIEVSLGWNDKIGKLSYGLKGNFAYNKNRVTKYKGKLERGWITNANGEQVYQSNIGDVSTGGTNRVLEGKIINEFYTMSPYQGSQKYYNSDGSVDKDGGPKDGMIRTEQDMEWLQAMKAAGYTFYPNQTIGKSGMWYGDYIYADLNGDGYYGNANDNDFRDCSNMPKYNFGFQAYATWNNFDFSMNWSGAAGFKIYYYTLSRNSTATGYGYSISRSIADDHYFYDPDQPNDPRTNLTSKNSRLTYNNSGSSQSDPVSTLHLEKGDFLKLKNLTFGYTLPSYLPKKVHVQNVRFFISGENLLTITKFTGMDPEMQTGFGYVTLRQYAFGVNVTF